MNGSNKKNVERKLTNTLNSVFRYLLIPFVVVGWAIGRYGMYTTFGKATSAMGIVGGLGLGLLGLLWISSYNRVFPWNVVAAIDVIVAVLMIIGLIRGVLYAFDDVKFSETVHSHFIDPIRINDIFKTLIICIIAGLSLYAFLRLLVYGR